MNNKNDKKAFWRTLPGILTGIASVIGAIGVIYGIWVGQQPTVTPTATQVSPTPPPIVSPSPTPEGPSPTDTLTPECGIEPGSRFESLWSSVRDHLGCPTNEAHSMDGAEQRFENGYMLWRKDPDTIYVMYDNHTFLSYGPSFAFNKDVDPETRGFTAPPELQEPRRGFGKIWDEELDGPDAAIGWAEEREYALFPPDGDHLEIQDFDRGVMFWSYRFRTHVLFFDTMTWQ